MKGLLTLLLTTVFAISLTFAVFAGSCDCLNPGNGWYGGSTERKDITDITFQTESYDGEHLESWEASKDGTMTGYLVDESTVIVSSNGAATIKCNQDCSCMFRGFESITNLDGLNLFDTSDVTRMDNMFAIGSMYYNGEILGEDTNSNLLDLDVSSFDTSKVTTMEAMFEDCDTLGSIDVSNFDTSNVKSFKNMFHNCFALISLDLSNFNTSNCEDFSYMFYDCINLTDIDVSSFDISSATNVAWMFNSLWKITELDLSNFGNNKITNFRGMFWDCRNLVSIDISNMNTQYATDTVSVFGLNYNCPKLQYVYVEENCKLPDADKRNIFYCKDEQAENDNEPESSEVDNNSNTDKGEVSTGEIPINPDNDEDTELFDDVTLNDNIIIEDCTEDNTIRKDIDDIIATNSSAIYSEEKVEKDVVKNNQENDVTTINIPSTVNIKSEETCGEQLSHSTTVRMQPTSNSSGNGSEGGSGSGGGGGGSVSDSTTTTPIINISWITYPDGIKAIDNSGNIVTSSWVRYINNWYIVDDRGNKVTSPLVCANGKYYSLDVATGVMRVVSGLYNIFGRDVYLNINIDGSIINYNDITQFNIVTIKTN